MSKNNNFQTAQHVKTKQVSSAYRAVMRSEHIWNYYSIKSCLKNKLNLNVHPLVFIFHNALCLEQIWQSSMAVVARECNWVVLPTSEHRWSLTWWLKYIWLYLHSLIRLYCTSGTKEVHGSNPGSHYLLFARLTDTGLTKTQGLMQEWDRRQTIGQTGYSQEAQWRLTVESNQLHPILVDPKGWNLKYDLKNEEQTLRCFNIFYLFSRSNQTVLHQFCCPAPEAHEGETSTACVPR